MKRICLILVIASFALAFGSCDRTVQPPDIIAEDTSMIAQVVVPEGSIYVWAETRDSSDGHFDTVRRELLSKIATMAGREPVLAFQEIESSYTSFLDIDRSGDFWFFYATDNRPMPQEGEWLRLPTSTAGPYSRTLQDTTYFSEEEQVWKQKRHQVHAQSEGQDSVVFEGVAYLGRKIVMSDVYEFYRDGQLDESVSFAATYEMTFVNELGSYVDLRHVLAGDEQVRKRRLVRIDEER